MGRRTTLVDGLGPTSNRGEPGRDIGGGMQLPPFRVRQERHLRLAPPGSRRTDTYFFRMKDLRALPRRSFLAAFLHALILAVLAVLPHASGALGQTSETRTRDNRFRRKRRFGFWWGPMACTCGTFPFHAIPGLFRFTLTRLKLGSCVGRCRTPPRGARIAVRPTYPTPFQRRPRLQPTEPRKASGTVPALPPVQVRRPGEGLPRPG
jgi:hypothetical protein